MSRISGVIQPLHCSHRLFGQCDSFSVDGRASASAFVYGVKLPAAERTNIIDKASIVFFQKGAWSNVLFFFLPPILRQFFLNMMLEHLGKAVNPSPYNEALKGIDVHIPYVRAAVSATYLADGLLLEFVGILLKALIDVT